MKPRRIEAACRAALSTCLILAGLLLTPPEALGQEKSQRVPQNFNIVSIRITNIAVQGGQLVAEGLAGTQPFSNVPVALSTPGGLAASQQIAQACPILDLQLGPIDVNLLGLRVQTSPICLEITAFEDGGLLGDLLCEVAQLLQGGMTLDQVLALLDTRGQLGTVLQGIENLLNAALDVVTSNTVGSQPNGNITASCTVLDLSLGPVELNLLGLQVVLDNCANGPVTVTVTAISGGGLLGDLLCSLADLLQGPQPVPTPVQTLLWRITRVLAGLLR